jgi:hypothetical protein
MSELPGSSGSFANILAHWDRLLAGPECMMKGCPLEATATAK